MTCVQCRNRPVADPDGVLCESCRVEELVSLARRRRELIGAEFGDLSPALCFLLNVMVDSGWSERAVTGAQRALSRPEAPVPAVFAHLVEPA